MCSLRKLAFWRVLGVLSGILAAPAGSPASAQMDLIGPGVSRELISGHFELQTLDGRQVTDAKYRGKWLLVYFGYTYCPDICPTVLLRVGKALDALGRASRRIQPIFITVDPARDTAHRLAQYLGAFDHRIIGLRGNPYQIQAAALAFHVYYRARSLGNGEYSVDHSSFLYLMAPDGHFEKLLADSLPSEQLAAELRQVVK